LFVASIFSFSHTTIEWYEAWDPAGQIGPLDLVLHIFSSPKANKSIFSLQPNIFVSKRIRMASIIGGTDDIFIAATIIARAKIRDTQVRGACIPIITRERKLVR
jgi:hypothetical protein